MTSYTNQEIDDIHFIYGFANGNVLESRWLYGERFASRRLPNRKTFEGLHRRVKEIGLFVSGRHDTCSTRSARTPELGEHVLREFDEPPETSTDCIRRRKCEPYDGMALFPSKNDLELVLVEEC
ncbi:DUF4817 domain-containing protein [Trichonephila inaurata madagascariensis]|uniref:DUF4817 domain-containing protein n=1 Tax=Trichonephila inaurata madagascariensis TaxID=2747483 RepID=A0A8X7CRM6_9ARAC|nr:DUF4817 domain-containing protein [Trichonephila inaurata madagascariensis]GFY75875.1 DUF4817 domain-containing protein [Trichonephila inaurata madagascariensis]